MREVDEEARRQQLKKDPRREPTDPPAPATEEASTEGPADSKPQPESKPEPEPKPEPEEPASSRRRPVPVVPDAPSEAGGRVVTAQDPRIAELEPLVAQARWKAILDKLGSEQDAGKLPPNLGLLYALAHKEHHVEAETTGEEKADPPHDDRDKYDANAVAIRCMAGLFGVPSESPIALVLGKRLIRANPVSWQKKKAPPAPISVLIVAIGLLLGAGIGWLLSFGYVEFNLPELPFFS